MLSSLHLAEVIRDVANVQMYMTDTCLKSHVDYSVLWIKFNMPRTELLIELLSTLE